MQFSIVLRYLGHVVPIHLDGSKLLRDPERGLWLNAPQDDSAISIRATGLSVNCLEIDTTFDDFIDSIIDVVPRLLNRKNPYPDVPVLEITHQPSGNGAWCSASTSLLVLCYDPETDTEFWSDQGDFSTIFTTEFKRLDKKPFITVDNRFESVDDFLDSLSQRMLYHD